MVASVVALTLLTGHVLKPAEPVSIKADLIGPYFYVNGEVNGKPVRLAVDSGAGLNVLTPKAAERLGITGGSAIDASGAGTAPVKAKLVTLDSIKVGGAELKKSAAVVVGLPEILEADGLVGYGFLQSFVMTFDYEKSTLTFTKPDEFKAPSGFIETPLRVRGNISEVKMTVDDTEGWVKVDTGASDTLTLFDSFVESRELRERLPDVKEVQGMMGVGGAIASDQAKIKGLILAGVDLPEMTISMSRQKSGAFADSEAIGNLGADILRRFTVILDYAHSKAYFKRNANFDAPTLHNRSGIVLNFDGKEHKVLGVQDGSVGKAAGIVAGDVVTEVDGKPVGKMRAFDVWGALRQKAGTKVKLKLKAKDGKEREVTLTLAQV